MRKVRVVFPDLDAALHEASHACTALDLNVGVGPLLELVAVPQGSVRGICRLGLQWEPSAAAAAVFLAGRAGERLFGIDTNGSAGDLTNARVVLSLAHNLGVDDVRLDALIEQAQRRADERVADLRDWIARVAKALAIRRRLTAREIVALKGREPCM
jgi:hypothetical protein